MRVAGFGFRGAVTLASLTEVLDAALAAAGPGLDALATVGQKADAPVLAALAALRRVPLHGVEVAGQATATQSARMRARFGTGSVAEAAALVAAGPGARLVVGRMVSADGMATAAIAEGMGSGQ